MIASLIIILQALPLQKPFDGRIVHAQQLPKLQLQKLEIEGG